MKIDKDDPRWTAYVLEEMSAGERSAFEREMGLDPEAHRVVEGIRHTSRLLEQGFAAEKEGAPRGKRGFAARDKVVPFLQREWVWNASMAALFVTCAGALFMLLKNANDNVIAIHEEAARKEAIQKQQQGMVLAQTPEILIQIRAEPEESPATPEVKHRNPGYPPATSVVVDTGGFKPASPVEIFAEEVELAQSEPRPARRPGNHADEDGFVDARTEFLSSFPVQVGSGSYDYVRESLKKNELPEGRRIQVEELVNAFGYSQIPNSRPRDLQTQLEVGACPWAPNHRLVRIVLLGGEDGAAANPRPEVVFNPMRVSRYRLIGSMGEGQGEGTVPGRLSAGKTVTALYEVVPIEVDYMASIPHEAAKPGSMDLKPKGSSEAILSMQLAFGAADKPGAKVAELVDENVSLSEASEDFRFAAAVAAFGMRLRDERQVRHFSFERIRQLAEGALGADSAGERARFVELVRQAAQLEEEQN